VKIRKKENCFSHTTQGMTGLSSNPKKLDFFAQNKKWSIGQNVHSCISALEVMKKKTEELG
jgi:hypothetical protein